MVKTFLLSLAPTRNGVYRTCLLTPSATDTFRTVGVFHRVDHHLASLCTFSAVNAFFHIYTVAVNGDLIEYGILWSVIRKNLYTGKYSGMLRIWCAECFGGNVFFHCPLGSCKLPLPAVLLHPKQVWYRQSFSPLYFSRIHFHPQSPGIHLFWGKN